MAKKKELKIVKEVGRPTTYDFELVGEICRRISDGEKLPDILEKEGMPARSTFFKWKRENKPFSDLYVNVQQDKGELLIEEIDSTVESLKIGRIEPSAANVIIQTLKWKAAKFYPKMFGDKVDVDHSGSVNVEFDLKKALGFDTAK